MDTSSNLNKKFTNVFGVGVKEAYVKKDILLDIDKIDATAWREFIKEPKLIGFSASELIELKKEMNCKAIKLNDVLAMIKKMA